MTIEVIDLGTAANDGTGDPVRIAGGKINGNFSELDSTKADKSDARFRPVAAFSAHKNGTAQTGVAIGTDTKVTFPTERYDLGGYYDTSTSRWTPPAGLVSLSGQVYITGTIPAGTVYVGQVRKNGAVLVEGFIYSGVANNGIGTVSVDDVANGTDYYEFYGRTSPSSGTATFDGAAKWTSFSGKMI